MSKSSADTVRFNLLLNELDVQAKRGQVQAKANNRRCPRYSFRTPCCVRFLPPGVAKLQEWPGRTRNLSRGGLALLVRREFNLGDAVEVELKLANQAAMFMVGIIGFCRYAGGGYHEVGIGLRHAGRESVFTSNLVDMASMLELLQERSSSQKLSDASSSEVAVVGPPQLA